MNVDTTVPMELSAEAFEAFLANRDNPGWLQDLRREAWAIYEQMAWPGRNSEEWSRTDIRLFDVEKYPVMTPAAAAASVEPQLNQGVELAGQSISSNGLSSLVELKEKWQEQGVICGSLEKLSADHAELIQAHLMTRAMDKQYDRFAALHAACWSGGHFV